MRKLWSLAFYRAAAAMATFSAVLLLSGESSMALNASTTAIGFFIVAHLMEQ